MSKLKFDLKNKSKEDVEKILSEAWLNIYVDEKQLFNPLDIPKILQEEPHLYITWLMTRPEYFYFICKEIFGIKLLPFQCAILIELWQRKFPMLIASRGAGKAISPDEKIRVKNGWSKIKDLSIGDKVYGGDGQLCTITNKTSLQDNLNFYRITLRDGRQIECCEDHLWKVWYKNNNRNKIDPVYTVVSTKDMYSKYFYVRKDSKSEIPKLCKEYLYAVPSNTNLQNEEASVLDICPYVVGILLGDGCLVGSGITFTTDDIEIVNNVNKNLPEGYLARKVKSSKYTYSIVRLDNTKPTFKELCKKIGIYGHKSENKFIPHDYLFASSKQKLALLKGLMDTDGTSSKNTIEYYTVSNKLSDDVLDLIRSLGISCKHSKKESWIGHKRYLDCNRISLYTNEAVFSLSRKLNYLEHKKSKQDESKYEKTFITNIEYIGKKDGMCIAVDNEDKTYITKDYIVTHNSFLLAIYALLRALLTDNRKVMLCGASFRQSKVIYEYITSVWNNSPILRTWVGTQGSNGPRYMTDMCRFTCNYGNSVTAIPIGDGTRIRGQRANDILMDEFASVPKDIFENVIAGFGSVTSAPADNVQEAARMRLEKYIGIYEKNLKKEKRLDNQIILSGTAFYDFNHFGTYWKKWKTIVKSGGDPKKIQPLFEDTEIPEDFRWDDYSVIRIPVTLVPKGFMDEGMVARSKATVHSGIYQMEFGAVFTNDSNGFFKRSLIESCCTHPGSKLPMFIATLHGNPNKKYVYGIDPASEIDHFAIVVLEINDTDRRVVYSWTTNKKQHREKVQKGLETETNFYSSCCRKIRNLMKFFPPEAIAIDSQGGGYAVMEGLHDQDKMEQGEVPLWEFIDYDKEKLTDGYKGLHILYPCNFASADWTGDANHGLRQDLEDKMLLFPFFDAGALGLAIAQDELGNKVFDTFEDCVMDIEELKDELSMIIITQTASGRDRWDTPEVLIPGGKKERLRKDRYSALLMANMVARTLAKQPKKEEYNSTGGFAQRTNVPEGSNFIGPAWFTEGMRGIY